MSITIPDMQLTGEVYQDLYGSTGIVPGTGLILQSKCSGFVRVQIRETQPPFDSEDGVVLRSGDFYSVKDSQIGCWVIGHGPLCVQEVV